MNEAKKWISITSMIKPRHWFGAVAVDEKIYVAGGYNERDRELSHVEVYDTISKTWETIPGMNIKREGCAAATVAGKIYIFGGNDGDSHLSSCEMFDPLVVGTTNNSWTEIRSMKLSRSGCTSCSIGTKIYVIGGSNGYSELSSVEVFDTCSMKWSKLPKMATERDYCSSVSIGDKIYVIGGRSKTKALSTVEVFDTQTHLWKKLPDMIIKREACAATAIGNQIHVFGGYDGNSRRTWCEVFDISTNTWSYTPNMKKERSGAAAVSIHNVAYVIGGHDRFRCLSSVDTYCTKEDLASLPTHATRKRNYSKLSLVNRENVGINNGEDDDHSESMRNQTRNRNSQKSIILSPSSNKTVLERIKMLEEQIGFQQSSPIMVNRIEHLESNILGAGKSTGGPILYRVKTLEDAFYITGEENT